MRTPTITDLKFYKHPDDMIEFFRRVMSHRTNPPRAHGFHRAYRKPVGKVDVKL